MRGQFIADLVFMSRKVCLSRLFILDKNEPDICKLDISSVFIKNNDTLYRRYKEDHYE